LENAAEAITARLAAKADWTVRALAADLATDGIKVSHDTVWRYLRSEGLSFKKSLDGQRDRSAAAGAPAVPVEKPPTSA
jgi:transposase